MLNSSFIRAALLSSCCPVPVHARAVANPALRRQQPAAPRDEAGRPACRRAMKWRPQRKRRSRRARTRFGSMARDQVQCHCRHVPIRLDDGKIAARISSWPHQDGRREKRGRFRFLYNGGPGAATIWLHWVRLLPNMSRCPDGFQPPPPYRAGR